MAADPAKVLRVASADIDTLDPHQYTDDPSFQVVVAIFEVPGAALDPSNAFVFDQVASAIAAVFVGPITYIGVTLLYYDMRIRKEGFDIEMLAQSL